MCKDHGCIAPECSVDGECDSGVCNGGLCVGCDETHVCRSFEPVCDVDRKQCEPCVASTDCESRANSPVCDRGECRGCSLDSECPSRACGDDGACIPDAELIWIASAGAIDQGTCTRSSPCGSMIYATAQLSENRNHIVLDGGRYPMRVAFSSSTTGVSEAFIHGNGSIISNPTTIGTALDLKIPFLLRKVTIEGSNGSSALIAGGPNIRLESVTISAAKAVRVNSGSVIATDIRISDSADTAAIIVGAGAELTINRGTISRSPVAITAAPGSTVHLRNLLVFDIDLRALELVQVMGELEFSTIADVGLNETAAPCAVACDASLRVTSSIIWQRRCSGVLRDAAGPCTFQSSILSSPAVAGAMNVDPLFVDQATHDYHLGPTSPARNLVDSGPSLDYEGESRPYGSRFDIGADEAR